MPCELGRVTASAGLEVTGGNEDILERLDLTAHVRHPFAQIEFDFQWHLQDSGDDRPGLQGPRVRAGQDQFGAFEVFVPCGHVRLRVPERGQWREIAQPAGQVLTVRPTPIRLTVPHQVENRHGISVTLWVAQWFGSSLSTVTFCAVYAVWLIGCAKHLLCVHCRISSAQTGPKVRC